MRGLHARHDVQPRRTGRPARPGGSRCARCGAEPRWRGDAVERGQHVANRGVADGMGGSRQPAAARCGPPGSTRRVGPERRGRTRRSVGLVEPGGAAVDGTVDHEFDPADRPAAAAARWRRPARRACRRRARRAPRGEPQAQRQVRDLLRRGDHGRGVAEHVHDVRAGQTRSRPSRTAGPAGRRDGRRPWLSGTMVCTRSIAAASSSSPVGRPASSQTTSARSANRRGPARRRWPGPRGGYRRVGVEQPDQRRPAPERCLELRGRRPAPAEDVGIQAPARAPRRPGAGPRPRPQPGTHVVQVPGRRQVDVLGQLQAHHRMGVRVGQARGQDRRDRGRSPRCAGRASRGRRRGCRPRR